jgi:hypothetical protein
MPHANDEKGYDEDEDGVLGCWIQCERDVMLELPK